MSKFDLRFNGVVILCVALIAVLTAIVFEMDHSQLVVLAPGLIIGLAIYWFSRHRAQRRKIDSDLLNLFKDWRRENDQSGLGRRR